MADKSFKIMITADASGAIKQMKVVNAETDEFIAKQGAVQKGQKKTTKSAKDYVTQQKGVGELTNNSTHAFAKMAQQMNGIVPVYATVAANVFAITAAFGALERAADFKILIDSADTLAIQTGRSLTALAENMKEITGSAISMKEALVQASIAASAGFDNTTIEKLTQVARNASVALGREMTDALNRVFKGAIKAEPELLDELGIILRLETAANKYATVLGKTAKELTTFEKQQAVVNEVLEQGEKKFGRLADIDPNPFTQLSAAFSEITTNLVNLLNIPIAGFIGFFTENIAALTAAIVLLAASIAKQALPALAAMGEGAIAAFTSIADTAKAADKTVQKFAAGVVKTAQSKSIAKTLSQEFKDLDAFAGKASFNKIFDKSIDGAERLKTALRSVSSQMGALTRKVNKQGFATAANINARIRLDEQKESLVKLNKAYEAGTIRVNTYASATSVMAKTVTFATNAISLGAGAMASFAFSLSHTAQSVFQTHGALSSTMVVLKNVKNEFTVATNKVVGLGSAFGALTGGIGAGLLKLVPIISIATIAWQVLGSAFTTIKNILGFEDIAKLSEKLEEQADALNESAAAAANYSENLADLPETLENVNDQLTLQANLIGELAGSMKKVNEAISIDEGFGAWDWLLDLVNAGQLDTFKESLNSTIEQIDRLGFASAVSEDVRDLADSWVGGGYAAEQYGKQIENLLLELQRYAEGAKEANQSIIDDIENLNKATSKLAGSLPSLSGVDSVFISISNLSSKLDSKNIRSIADSISRMSSLTIGTLGIEDLSEDVIDYLNNLNAFEKGIKMQQDLIDNYDPSPEEKVFAIPAIKAEIKRLEDQQQEIDKILADKLISPLSEAVKKFKELSNASRLLKVNLLELSLDKLNAQNNGTDIIDILRKETALRLKTIDIETEAAVTGREIIAEADAKLYNERLIKQKLLNKTTDQVAAIRLASELGTIESRLATNRLDDKKLQLQLDKTRGKSAELVKKLFQSTTKEINKVVALQAQGVTGLEKKYLELDNTLKSSVSTLVDLTGKTKEWAEAILLTQKYAEKTEKFLKENRISSTTELQKQIFNIESANIGMEAQLAVSKNLNNMLFTRADAQWQVADATMAANIALQQSRFIEAQNIVDAGAATPEIEEANEAEFQKQKAQLEVLERLREVSRTKNILFLQEQSAHTIANMQLELGFLKQKARSGSLFNKLDREALATAKLKAKLKGNRPEDIERIIKLQKDLNKETRKFDFAKSLQEAAESMNDLADGMKNLFEALQDDQFDNFAAGLILLQDIGQDIDTPMGNLAEGFATLGLATEQYADQLKSIEINRAAAMDEGPLTQLQLENFELQEQQANYTAISNAAGAMAGAFEEGSAAAKAFMLVQQAAAIASAAQAIATQGGGDTYSAFARIAAMISLMSSVLGAAGIAFGGNTSTGANVEKDYKTRLGSDALLDRDLQGNYLVDALDELVDIDTQLFSATRDLQITMKNLGETFERIGAVVFASISGQRVTDFANIGEFTSQNNESIVNTIGDIAGIFDDITLGMFGGSFAEDLFGGLAGGLFGSTTVTSSVLDTGIDFETLIQITEDGLTGTFSRLDQLSQVLVKTEDSGFLGFGGSSSAELRAVIGTLNTDLTDALSIALNQTLNVVNGLITTFADSVGGIDIKALFGNVSQEVFGDEFISLFELNAEDSGDAIGLYFSALSSDLLGEVLPFLQDYAKAGEELGETMTRLTINTIKLSNSLSIVDLDLEDVIGNVSISSGSFLANITNTISNDISKTINILEDEDARLRNYYRGLLSLGGGLLSEAIKFANDEGKNAIARLLEIENELRTLQSQDITTEAAKATAAAAEAFKLEVVAAWERELLSNFKDIDEFQEIFAMFSKAIFSETELLDIAMTNATTNIADGFTALIDQVDGFSSTDLTNLLEQSGGDFGDALRIFYEDALTTGLFNADIINGTEIDTAGADAFATVVKLGASINQLDELMKSLSDEIETLNTQYVQQILLFGKLEKEASLLALAFDFSDAIAEAEETGSDLALVEQAFALERLAIIKEAFELIDNEITDAMDSIVGSILEVAETAEAFDNIAFATIKINKLVEQLKKGTSGINLDSLLGDTSGFEDFIDNFQDVIDSLSTEGPGSISEEIALVDQLRTAITDKYALEVEALELNLDLLEEQKQAYKDLSVEIQSFLADLILSDSSPLTNFEKLSEAETQFLVNAANIFSEDEEIAAQAAADLLSSADTYLEAASGFFAIGPEYAKIFDQVTSVLSGIDTELLVKTDETVLAIETLTATNIEQLDLLNSSTIEQLNILDSILDELQIQNQATLEADIVNNITEGMLPLIDNITDKLQSIDDGTWTDIVNILDAIASASIADYESVVTPTATYITDPLTGDTTQLASGTPFVPEDMIAQIHQGELIVPESMAQGLREGTLSLGDVQDNSDVVEAIRELTTVLAISQEDIVDAANRNVEVSQNISESMSNNRQVVRTSGVI